MRRYDVIVIGTGFGGSPVACRLAQAGAKVLVLERGPHIKDEDFVQSFSMRNLLQYYQGYYSKDFSAVYRVSKVLGGGTVTFDGGCLRAPSEVFDYKDRFGYKIWPDEVN